jgi:pyruvate kinase
MVLPDGTVVVPVAGDLGAVRARDTIRFSDARGRSRRVHAAAVDADGVDAVGDRTSYLVPGTELVVERLDEVVTRLEVGDLPEVSPRLEVRAGDLLDVVAGDEPARPAVIGPAPAPARIGCSLPEALPQVRVGERILFDDGLVAAVVREAAPDRLRVQILRPSHANLKPEKGINLPDTALDVPALTADDAAALEEVASIVDLVSLSFVERPSDVAAVLDVLGRLGAPHVGLILKIETRRAFEALPLLLLEAMRHERVAVMVARGDLAVEVGFERLAEVQEEILWLCEAAHVPVIWATQVLESLAKVGQPTRAEITDAATGSRAECVMLNKGPYVTEAVRVLDDVLGRMRQHQDKRTWLLRRLAVSDVLGALVAGSSHAAP